MKYSLVGHVGIDENKLLNKHSDNSPSASPRTHFHKNFDVNQYILKYDGAAYSSNLHTGDVIIGVDFVSQQVVAVDGSADTVGAVATLISVSDDLSTEDWNSVMQSWDLLPTSRSNVTIVVARW